jgi:hypothetical protein
MDKKITGDSISFYFTRNVQNFVLAPGHTDSISIDFFPHSSGLKTAKLKITSSDPFANNKYINLIGNGGGNPTLFSSNSEMDFGDIIAGQYKDSVLVIRNIGNLDLNITSIVLSGDGKDYFNILKSIQPYTLMKGQSDALPIRAIGALPIGSKSAQLQISSNDLLKSAFSINLNSFMRAPILSKNISYISIDSISVGTKFDTIITIRNDGNANLVINKIFFDGPAGSDYSLNLVPDQMIIFPNDNIQIAIHFVPMLLGQRDARLVINSNDPAYPDVTINLRGFGKGNPILTVYPQNLNFGFVDSNKTKDLSFTIKNIGFTVLQITSIVISGSNSSQFALLDHSLPFVIKSLDSQTVNVRYTANPLYNNPSAKIQIFSNDQKSQSQGINLIAFSQRPFMTIDSILNFTSLAVSDSAQKDLVITNNSSVYFTIDTIYFDSFTENPFKINNLKYPIQVDPSGKYQLTIKYNPRLPKSFTSFLNIISFNASNSPFRVKITGNTSKPVITVQTNPIDFRYVELNNSRDTVLTIGNSGQTNLQIDSLSISGPNSGLFATVGTTLPMTILPSRTQNVTLRFSPGTNKTLATANLKIISNDLDRPNISIPLSGTGDSPAIASDSLVDFGKVVVLDSIQKDIQITNTSSVNLRIDSISITLDTNRSFSYSGIRPPLIIGPNSSMNMSIKFNPKNSGSYLTNINIYSSADSKNPLKIKLLGGTTSPQMVIPNIITFGKLKTDSSKTARILILNSGDGYLSINNIILTGKDTSEFILGKRTFPFRLNPGVTDSVSIQFNPKIVGKKDAKVIITSNDIRSSGEILIDAEGFKQNLMYDPAAINFNDVTFTKTKIDSIILQNQGTVNLVVNSIIITGSNATHFSILNIDPGPVFTLNPNERKTIPIQFRPDSVGPKTANLEISSTDPLKPKIIIPLTGNCITPTISSVVNQLNFANVRVNNNKDSILVYRNTGNGILILKSITISGKDSTNYRLLRYNIGKEIANGQNDTIIMRFTPLTIGDKTANLVMKSNDYANQTVNIPISGKGINPKISISVTKVDMGRIFTIRTKDTTLTVTNDGSDNLLLKNINITGADSNKFTVSSARYTILKNIILAPGEVQTFQIRFYPQQSGIKNAVLSVESDDPSTGITTVQLTGEGYIPALVVDNNLIADENTDKIINFHLSDDFTPRTVKIFYRKGGDVNYDSVSIFSGLSVQSTSALNYTYTFNKNLITKNGLDFYIRATWDGAASTIPQTNYLKNPLSLRIKLSVVNSAFQLITKSYSMITVPLQFQGTTLLNEMIRNLGSINNSSWRIFKYRNSDYEEYTDENGWQIGPGDGFWLIAKDNKTIDFQNCLTIPTNTPYTINLQPGWNQIGSPFLFSVPVSNIVAPLGKSVENALWGWNGEDGYNIETTNMNPWVGYFIKNNETDSVNITISATRTLARIENVITYQPNEWKILISGNINGRMNNNAEIGCIRNSTDEWDGNDISEPPMIPAKYYTIRFPHSDWKVNRGNYVRDYRSISQEGKSWDMEIMNLTDGKDGEIKLVTNGNIPENFQIMIYDYDQNKQFKVVNSYKFKFKDQQQIKKLKLIVGTKTYIDENQVTKNKPDEFKLAQNYPNPFNPSTVISYQIPISNHVTLKIYDMMGREVTTLVSDVQQAGSYDITWNANGVPSGVYYCRLISGSFIDTKKLVLLK